VDGAMNMRQIILDILEYSKIGTMDMPKEEVNLNEVLDEYTLLNNKVIQKKGVRIISTPLPFIRTYKAPITLAIHHILDNAIKYSKEEIPPEINVFMKSTTSHWEVSIQDNGIGMDKEYFEKIFVMFQRLHDRNSFQGTGIGLSIVKKIMDRMDGNVTVDSEVGHGSTFTLSVPKIDMES